jgi:gas vesicle protein
MKKLCLVFAIAGSLVACDNSADTAQQAKDSLDSVTNLQKESVEDAAKDAKENLDSTSEAVKDSVDAAVDRSEDTTKH